MWNLIMSKRYSGKSFKDSSVKKNLNWALKKKENLKKISKKRQINPEFRKLFKPVMSFFEF